MTPPPGVDGLYVEKGKGSARRGGRGVRGGESTGLGGRQTWRRGDRDSGGGGVAVMGNSYRRICKGRG
eukprot:scaffold3752_cov117-Isochrysis_galbana.AAC.6